MSQPERTRFSWEHGSLRAAAVNRIKSARFGFGAASAIMKRCLSWAHNRFGGMERILRIEVDRKDRLG
jgi:hypothetical protein